MDLLTLEMVFFFTIYNNVYEHAQFDFPYEHPIPHNHSLKCVTLIK